MLASVSYLLAGLSSFFFQQPMEELKNRVLFIELCQKLAKDLNFQIQTEKITKTRNKNNLTPYGFERLV